MPASTTKLPNYLMIPQAAAELDEKPPSVHGALNKGRLPFVMLYGRKLITCANLDAYKQRTRLGGEKPKGRPQGSTKKVKQVEI